MIPPGAIVAGLRSSTTFPGGQTFPLLCLTIANSIAQWIPTGIAISGVTAGAIGTGTVNGSLMFTGNVAAVTAAMTSNGLIGQTTPMLATMLALGLSDSLTGSTYQGTSTGVAVGIDTSTVIPNISTLAAILRTNHTALCATLGGTGSITPTFYQGIAAGIGVVMSTGITIPGTGLVTGSPGPGSSVGTSISLPT